MEPLPERRRRGSRREKYPVLRLYTRVISLSSFVVLVMGVLFGVLVMLYAEQPLRTRLGNGLTAIGLGFAYFVIARSVAEVLYLLLDVARHTRASREILEELGGRKQEKPGIENEKR
jgi:hypothetical protein